MYSSSSQGAARVASVTAADGEGRDWVGRVGVTLWTCDRSLPRHARAAMAGTGASCRLVVWVPLSVSCRAPE